MATFCEGVVQEISKTECIGNSLVKINNNFSGIEAAGCDLETRVTQIEEVIGGSSPTLIGIRLSYSATTPTPLADIKNATTLYVHPYKGNIIPLFNSIENKWFSYRILNSLSFSLANLTANTNYDIFLFREAGIFKVEFVAWASSIAGGTVPIREYQDTVAVKLSEPHKRLIGCLRTTNAGQSEQSFGGIDFGGSHPKQFLWNAQNVIPISVQNFDSGAWTYPRAGWGPTIYFRRPDSTNPLDVLYYNSGSNGFGVGNPHPFEPQANWFRTHQQDNNNPDGRNNRFSFIIGEQTLIDMTYQGYINGTNSVGYVGIGQNSDTAPTYVYTDPQTGIVTNGYQLIGEMLGDSQTPRSTFKKAIYPGFHYLQTFDMSGVTNILWGEGHAAETGFLASLYN